jgi:hypothetical protein
MFRRSGGCAFPTLWERETIEAAEWQTVVYIGIYKTAKKSGKRYVAANKELYGIHIETNARKFYQAVYGNG